MKCGARNYEMCKTRNYEMWCQESGQIQNGLWSEWLEKNDLKKNSESTRRDTFKNTTFTRWLGVEVWDAMSDYGDDVIRLS